MGAVNFNYPVFLDLSNRLAVIIGGGAVASRKAKGLLEAGCANVRAIAPEFSEQLPPEVHRITEEYEVRHLDGASIVFAATNSPQVNQRVVRDAEARNLLVCRADNDDLMPGNFSNPAVYRDRALGLAVSAGGSPLLAVEIRDRIVEKLSPSYAALAEAMQELRPRIRSLPGLDISGRRVIFADLASSEAMAVLSSKGKDALWQWLRKRHGIK